MRRTIPVGLGLLGLVACDEAVKDNPLDPEASNFVQPVVISRAIPEGAGTVLVEQGNPGWLDASVSAVASSGWYFHHWVGRSATGSTSPTAFLRADGPGDTVRVEAMFLPDWTRTDSVLVDDFDHPDPISATGRHTSDLISTLQDAGKPYGSGGWEAGGSETAVFFPLEVKLKEANDGDWRNTRVVGAGWNGGSCQHLSVRRNGGWANASVYLKPWNNPVDLSAMRAVRFWAKGTGTITVGFVTIEGMQNGDYAPIESEPIKLVSQWTRYDIDPTTMTAPAWSSITSTGNWDRQKSALGVLKFDMVSDSVDFWLDDVWLVGTPFSSFL